MHSRSLRGLGIVLSALLVVVFSLLPFKPTSAENERVITVYFDGNEQTVVTDAATIGEVLKRAKITVADNDLVEPGTSTLLSAPSYNVNIYRARPVTVVDGEKRVTIITPQSSAPKIAQDAGISLYDEDLTEMSRIDNFLAEDGVGLKLTIKRATPMTLVLYGKLQEIRTQAVTVGDLLKEKSITLSDKDGTNLPLETPISAGLKLDVWRDGVQTVTVEEDIAFETEFIRDGDRPVGYKQVQTAGVTGKRLATYEVNMRNGEEQDRKEIQSVITTQAKNQVEVLGIQHIQGVSDPAANRILGHRLMLSAGFGEDQWPCLLNLWDHESQWGEYKSNSSSGAYGIPQALPGSKMGDGWQYDPVVQITWGLNYIKSRYSTPCGAWNFWLSKTPHWY